MPEITRQYTLKSKDIPILDFDIVESNSRGWLVNSIVTNLRPYEENLYLWPKGLPRPKDPVELRDYFNYKWLLKRKTVEHRPNARNILECGTDGGNQPGPYSYININLGMSFRDTYWIVPKDEDLKWEDWSPYTHTLDKEMSDLAISEWGSFLPLPEPKHRITCEPTTAGTMRKCWTNKPDGSVWLLKAFDYTTSDNRVPPRMEYYAAQAAEALGINHVKYDLLSYTHVYNTTEPMCECKLFTSEETGFIPAMAYLDDYYLRTTGKRWDRRKTEKLYDPIQHRDVFAKIFGEDFYSDMMLLDSVILFLNRHWNNFGYLIDNATGEILAPAPLLAHGYSMLVTERDIDCLLSVMQYPDVDAKGKYLSFNEMAYYFTKERHIPALERMSKEFEFKQPEDLSLGITDDSLKCMTEIVRIRCKRALDLFNERHRNGAGK